MKAITATGLARNLRQVLDRLAIEGEEIVIERNSEQVARLLRARRDRLHSKRWPTSTEPSPKTLPPRGRRIAARGVSNYISFSSSFRHY